MSRRTFVAAVGAALMAARNRLRLVTACRKRTLDTGGHTGRPYNGDGAGALGLSAQTRQPSGRAMRVIYDGIEGWYFCRQRAETAG